MVKEYTFNYGMHEAEACFKVDTEKFSNEHAKETLDFFIWEYDKKADSIDEVMKKYAMEAIMVASAHHYNTNGVINYFSDNEGFCKIDGSCGILLTYIQGYEFDEEQLDVTVEIIE